MAKSLRSKSRRRNVRAQREKYNARVIDQLKKTLGLTKEYEKIRREEIMKDVSEINMAIEAYEKKNKAAQDVEMLGDDAKVTDGEAKESDSAKPKEGQHPVWKSQRKLKAAKKARKANKVKKEKKAKKVGKNKAGKNKN